LQRQALQALSEASRRGFVQRRETDKAASLVKTQHFAYTNKKCNLEYMGENLLFNLDKGYGEREEWFGNLSFNG